jgi:hypothetical protein
MAVGIGGSGTTARTPIPTPRTGALKRGEETPPALEPGTPSPETRAVTPESVATPAAPEVVAGTRERVNATGEALRQNLELARQRFATDANKLVTTVHDAVADGTVTSQERSDVGKAAHALALDSKQVELAAARVQLDDLKTALADRAPNRRERMELRSAQTRVQSLEKVVSAMGGDPSVQVPEKVPAVPSPDGQSAVGGGRALEPVPGLGEGREGPKSMPQARPPKSPDRRGI